MSTFESRYDEYLSTFENYLTKWCDDFTTKPLVLGESMKYSLLAGGKRIRPVLMLAVADVLGVDSLTVLPFALALEMIHTYSLIHDDLPCMDNDDFRRGKPTNHKAFGENNAVLAGDALLNTAYSICFKEGLKGEQYVKAGSILCENAGVLGMIAGQSADLQFEKTAGGTEEDLVYIYENKTGKLLMAPALIASVLSGEKWYFEFEKYSYHLGQLFQITDDILDETSDFTTLGKSIGKDAKEEKFTSIRFYGLNGAGVRADIYAQNAHAVLDGIEGDTSFLHDLVDYVRNRKK